MRLWECEPVIDQEPHFRAVEAKLATVGQFESQELEAAPQQLKQQRLLKKKKDFHFEANVVKQKNICVGAHMPQSALFRFI